MICLNNRNIPKELLTDTLKQLPVSDICNMSLVSKIFNQLANDQHVWKNCFHMNFDIKLFEGFETVLFPCHPSKDNGDWKSFYQNIIEVPFHRFGKLKFLVRRFDKSYYSYTARNLDKSSIDFSKMLIKELKEQNTSLDLRATKDFTTLILDFSAIIVISRQLSEKADKKKINRKSKLIMKTHI